MAKLKKTTVEESITGNLIGNADTATNLKTQNIKTSEDLNKLIIPGCFVTENAQGLVNCPTVKPFYLKVEQISTNIIKQTIYTTDNTEAAVIYMRTKVNTNFSKWSKLTGIQIS